MDNASNCDTAVDHLGTLIAGFRGRESRTRCFAHTVNLIAKVGMNNDIFCTLLRPGGWRATAKVWAGLLGNKLFCPLAASWMRQSRRREKQRVVGIH